MPDTKAPRVFNPLRVAAFDIETQGGFNATWGRILCGCFMFADEAKPRTFRSHRRKDERSALKDMRDSWNEADIILTWYGKRFDGPFVNAKLIHYGMKKLDEVYHVDLIQASRKLAFQGNKLDGFAKHVRLENQKYHVEPWCWQCAVDNSDADSERAFEEIVTHCEHDVLMTLEAGHRLREFIGRSITKWGF